MKIKVCKFNLAWRGECGQPTSNSKWCDKHQKKKCWKCGKQATGECDNDAGSFVCGMPQCEKHSHWDRHRN